MTLLLLFNAPASGVPATFTGDFAFDGVERPEYLFLGLEGTDNQGTPSKVGGLAKWEIVKSTVTSGGVGRLRQLVCVIGGVVYTQGAGGTWDSFADPTLDGASNYYWAIVHSQKLYLGDGLGYVVYDPKAGTLKKWTSTGSGTLPEKCQLAEVYLGRVVLARPAGQPQNWYMSALDDPNNWDFFPPTITVTQAVFGNNSEAGLCPDVINTLIPYHDDYLIFGCDSSIWRLTGDPMAGGRFDRISDSTGMAFGKPWCKDPTGVVYFFGSKGGVYRMAPGGQPTYLSDAMDGQDTSVQSRLAGIDMSLFRLEMRWDFERQGVCVFQIPYDTAVTSAAKAWFWDSKNNAWWEDTFGSANVQAFTTFVADGDAPADRKVVLGCKDGFLRELDSAAVSDDGVAIDAFVTIGPISTGSDRDVEILLNRLKVILASDLNGCTYEVHTSDTPGKMKGIVASGALEPGQNPRLPVRKRGSFMWLVLRNNSVGQRFAVEEIVVDISEAGIRRTRP